MIDRELIEHARKHIETDPHLAVFMVRDLEVTKRLGLTDLCWSMVKNGGSKNDARWVFELLDKEMLEA